MGGGGGGNMAYKVELREKRMLDRSLSLETCKEFT